MKSVFDLKICHICKNLAFDIVKTLYSIKLQQEAKFVCVLPIRDAETLKTVAIRTLRHSRQSARQLAFSSFAFLQYIFLR